MNTLDKLQNAYPNAYRKGNVLLVNCDCMELMKRCCLNMTKTT